MTIKNSHLKTVAYTASLLISSNLLANSNCSDELYGINAGRGESGYAMELNLRHSGDISSENPVIKVHSKALFSSAAMAYVNSKNRIYYISAPRAGKYAAGIDWNNVLDDVNSTEEKSLPFFSKKQIQVEIAYIDLDSGEHISLAKLPYWKRMYRLAYDPSDGHLYGSHYNRFYKINPQTGETIDLDRFSGHSSPKDIWRGDLAYKDGALYLVTNTKIFKVNKNTSVLSELATHNLQNITGAIFDKDDNLILSQLRVSDYGSFNKSKLHNVSLITGDTCKIMDVPAEISDLAYINPKLAPPPQRSAFANESFLNCSTEPLCQPTQLPAISLQAVTDTVTEGGFLAFQLILDNPFPADVEVNLSISYETTETDDIIFTYTDNIIIKKEETSFDVEIETVDNDDYQGTRTFILKALAVNNALGDVEAVATINDDENNIPKFNCNGKNQLGVYAGTNTAQGMLIIDCSANHPKPRIYPHASMCSTAKGATLKWESSAKGKREKFTKGWVEIEQDELDTLMSVSYECANQPHSDCPHGTTFGRILDSRLVTSISINNNNVPSCNINYNAKYCIGDGNKTESKSYNLSQCNR